MRISAIQCRTNTGQMAEIPVTELLQVLSANGTPLGDGIVPKSQGGRYIASGISVDATGQIKFDGYRSDRAFTGIATGIIGFTNDGRLVTLPLQQTSTASNPVSESEETMSSIENTLSFFSDNAGTLASSSILNDNGNYSVGGLSAFWKWDVNAGSINIDQGSNTITGGADGYRINGKLVLSYNPITKELTIGNATYKTTNIQYLKSHSVAFNINPVGVVMAPGVMSWNDTYGTVEIGLKGGNLIYKLGQSSMVYVKHADNSGLTKGTVVYPVGSDGSNKTVRLARADIEATSSKTFGVIAETVTGGEKAFCITEGLVENINTSSLTEGSAVYLSPSVAGGFTTTKPSAPNHMVLVGFCIKSHAVNGSIFVKVQNGFEIDELHDVAIGTLANNNLLAYEAGTSLWKNKTFAELGIVSGTGTTNFVTKWSNATGGLTNSQIFDNGVNVGIATPTPTAKLEINQDANAMALLVTGGSGGFDMARFVRDVGGNVTVGINGSGGDAQIYFTTTGNTFAIGTDSSSFKISDSTAVGTNDRLTIDSIGNVGIGTTITSHKLVVNGTSQTTNLIITNGAAVGKVWQCNNLNGSGEWVTPLSSERYIGEWAANSGVAPSASPTTGDYYVVNTAGTYLGITYASGDEIYWNGTAWLKRSNFLTLPIATASVLGGIKIGTGLAIDGSGVVSVASSPILTTARTISATGDGTWSVSFNGSADVSGALTLANVATEGTYRSVTINAKGLVTAGTNPTTVSGYGITDFYAQIVSGFVTGANSTVLNTDSLEVALEKLQGQINARISGNQTITLSGIVTGSGTTAITTSIADAALSIAKTSGLQTALDGKFTTPTGLTTNFISKWVGSAFANSQIFDNGTRVGIGTVSPQQKLDIVDVTGIYFRHSEIANTSGAFRVFFGTYTGNGMTGLMANAINGNNQLQFGGGTLLAEPATRLLFYTGAYGSLGAGTERMRIDSSGLVGINTTTPAYTLDVLGTTRTTNLLITSGATSGNFLKCNNVNGTSVWSSITTSDISNLSSWAGSTSITTLGTITTGTWNGSTIATTRGGTGLTAIGTANQLLRVNAGATALEYFTPTYISGNQTITLTGIITGSGTTAITTAIADGALSIAKTSGLQTALDGKQATLSGTGLILSTAGTITYVTNNSANWNTAFGWGNHASAGYLLASTAATTYQPLDADLTSIAGLTGTTGLLRKTAANTFVLDTATYLTGITSLQVTTALGFTPYNATNPSGFITSSGSITGSAATLTTARTFTIGTTGKTFNGSANVAWTLGEIGAAPTVHTHAAVDIVSGVIAQARLGSGTASATTFLRGDQTWATLPAPTLTSTRIGFGSGSNLLTSSANFAFEDDRIISIKNGGTSKMEIARYVGLNNYGLYVHGGNLELQVISGGNIFSQSNHSFQGRILLNNLAGTAGQVLTSQGSGANPTWTTVSGGTQDLDDVLGVGNTAINKQIILNGTNSVFDSAAIMFYKNGAEKGKLHYDNQFVERLRLSSTSIIQIESSVSVGLYGTSAIIGSLSGTGTRMVVADASGVLSTQAIPSGGGVPALTSTQIAFGGGSNLMTSSSNFVYNSSIKRLEVDNIWFWRGSANDSLSLSIGTNSLSSTTSGYSNIAIGYDALKANTGGYLNAAIGLGALTDNTTGNYNTGVGTATLTDNTTGSRNTAIGYSANVASGNLTNATAIGYGALVSTSNSIMLGNFSITGLFCYETSISSPSDIRDKKNINDNSLGVNFINKLRTVTFEWNRRDGGSEGKEIGFIAQEVLSLEEEFEIAEYSKLVKTHNSEKLFLAQGRLIPILTRAIQEQQDQIDELKNIIYNINLKL